MEERHFAGASIMDAAEKAAAEYGCGVDDLDYELVADDDENKQFNDPENPVEIVVYGVFEQETPVAETPASTSTSGSDAHSLPRKDPATLSEEEFDFIADTATETIRDILKYFGAEGSEIDEYEGDEGEIILDVVGSELAYLIGRHGKTLDAFQFLVTSITNKKLGFRVPVTVDVEGYKNRRKEKIENMALNAASRAIRQGGEVRMRPMSPYERRIVHLALRENDRVETYSEGEDPSRYVIIKAK